MKLTRRLAMLAAAWTLAAAPALAADKPVTVFAAASLKNALDEVGAVYAAKTGGEARFSYAGSAAIARQIEQGAPADVYISADSDWMDYLAGKKLIVAASRRDLLTNHLALIAPTDAKTTLKVAKGMPLAKALGRAAWPSPVPTCRPASTPRPRSPCSASGTASRASSPGPRTCGPPCSSWPAVRAPTASSTTPTPRWSPG
uniref:Molybdate-binding protein ModA n=1 Tax=Phenylobacterium glaciei TaxID=2803784 RepID=A0A974S983_9CAUL|nr:molybdate ABC transporter substrate-binding protein [Phenylobacterium glaciei]